MPVQETLCKVALLVDSLHQAQARNDYSSSKTLSAFLDQTNRLLQTTANDKHLRLLGPQKFSQMMAMFYGDETEHDQQPSDEHSPPENPLSVVGVSNVSEISRDGLNQTGYLALERFDGSARSVAFIERVFSSFTESDNMIIDLRNSGGGDAEMAKALSSYFFDEPTHLLNTTMPGEDGGARIVVERWTEPNQLSPYFAERPLKILISPKTFSATEPFSFGMQAALTSFTEQSGKLDELENEELSIYEQLQKYANAWYGADHETMKDLLADEFIGVRRDQRGAEVERISFTQLVANTKDGKGRRENEIYCNRIIRDIDVTDEKASVMLVLRETIHHMSLTKSGDEWLITRDDIADKRRGRI